MRTPPLCILISSAICLPTFAQSYDYVDWQSVHIMHAADSGSATGPSFTFNDNNPRSLGTISSGGNSASVSAHGCFVNSGVASGAHRPVIDGTSNKFSTSAHSPSVPLTDFLVTDIGTAGTTDLVFDFGGATLTNVVVHFSNAFRTSGSNSGAYKTANYQFISNDINSMVVNTPSTGAGSHKWIINPGNTLTFGNNSPTDGTVVLMGNIKGFTLRSNVENYLQFQIGAESVTPVPEPSSSALLGFSGLALALRRHR
ncbi:MAG: PEP-CTERM sorting domain-containing protein [Akkermansiaceae bacterium]